jgi:hypothetical protein
MKTKTNITPEHSRLAEQYAGQKDWLHWGPYLSERQWGTVREDYSPYGNAWEYFSHDQARSRAYRWGEDGIAGISDEKQRLCFAVTLWNGKDPILKERLFGLTGTEGNHGEDVKELYYYLDNTPTHSYMKHLYKYPQAAFPYADLVNTNRNRGRNEPEYELLDTGVFDENRYFDVFTEYAKADDRDLLISITVHNRAVPGQGPEAADIHLLPTLWFRNGWSFGRMESRPRIRMGAEGVACQCVTTENPNQADYSLYFEPTRSVLFTENETNTDRLFGQVTDHPYKKDAFHKTLVEGNTALLAGRVEGSKVAPVYKLTIPAGQSESVKLRLVRGTNPAPLGADFDAVFAQRRTEADVFYATIQSPTADAVLSPRYAPVARWRSW